MEVNPMKETPEIRTSVESLIRNTRDYAETRMDLLILTAKEKSASTLADMAKATLLAITGLICLLFLSIGTASYIGELTGKPFIGFLSVAGFYLVSSILIYVFRETLIYNPLLNHFIEKLSSDEKD